MPEPTTRPAAGHKSALAARAKTGWNPGAEIIECFNGTDGSEFSLLFRNHLDLSESFNYLRRNPAAGLELKDQRGIADRGQPFNSTGGNKVPVSAEIRDSIAWFTGSGLVEADEIATAFHGLYRQTAPRCCVFDFRNASFSALPAGEFRKLAANTLPYSERRGPDARSVFCVATAADMRFVRAFVANAATVSDTRFEVFFTMEDCLDWLGADQDEVDTADTPAD